MRLKIENQFIEFCTLPYHQAKVRILRTPVSAFTRLIFRLNSGAIFMEYTPSSLDENGSTNARIPGRLGGVAAAGL